MRNDTIPRTHNLRPVIILLGLLAACLIVFWIARLPEPNRNVLAISKKTKAESVNIDIRPPVELDGKSKTELLQLRAAAVQQYPELLASE